MAETTGTFDPKSLESEVLLEASPDAIVIVDVDGRIVFANAVALAMFGYDRRDLLGKSIEKLVPEAMRTRHRDLCTGFFAAADPAGMGDSRDVSAVHHDGRTTAVDVKLSSIEAAGSRFAVCMIREISERKALEAGLTHVASFPEQNPYPVVEVGFDGAIHFMNAGAQNKLPDLAASGGRHPFLADWEATIGDLQRQGEQGILREVLVGEGWYQQAIYVLPDAERVRIYAYDITERKMAQERQRQEERDTIGYQSTLLDLAKSEIVDLRQFLRHTTEQVAKAVGIDRVGVWLMDGEKAELVCGDLYVDSRGIHEAGRTLHVADYPRYFQALGGSRVIAVREALEDPRTAELAEIYFRPEDISSVMHVPIRHRQQVVGVLCHEHVGPPREWQSSLREFAASVAGTIGLTLETLERRKAENEMQRLATGVSQSTDWVYITDRNGTIEYVNEAVVRVSGFTREELVGANPRIWKSGSHQMAFYQELWNTLVAGKPFFAIFVNKTKSGKLFHLDQTITPVRDQDGTITSFVGSGKDITQQKLLEEKINYLSYYDALTELPNRNLFFDRLEQAIRSSERKASSLAVLLLDVDNFKYVNDTQGSEIGDVVLRKIARRLTETVFERDTVSRFGNDEYGVIAEVAKIEDIVPLIEKLRVEISRPIEADGVSLSLTVNIGISVFPDDGADASTQMVKNADLSLAQAKGEGRNGFKFFTSNMDARISDFVVLEHKLNTALERDEFVMYYQPYFDIGTGKLAGMESLIRWISPEEGLVGPDRFIPVLEETKHIIPVGWWIIDTVCLQIREWVRQGFAVVPVAINLSAIQFAHEDLPAAIDDIVRTHMVDRNHLVFEITESTFMRDAEYTQQVLERLKTLGFAISIDDFGTGYSSLAYLKRFPVDNLKIDLSFVKGINDDPDDASIVATIISMAHNLNLKTIAEGVESDEHFKILRILRCDMAQGYGCGRPMPPAEATKLLEPDPGV